MIEVVLDHPHPRTLERVLVDLCAQPVRLSPNTFRFSGSPEEAPPGVRVEFTDPWDDPWGVMHRDDRALWDRELSAFGLRVDPQYNVAEFRCVRLLRDNEYEQAEGREQWIVTLD